MQAVYAKIKRKSEQLDGHILKLGGQLVLDDFAEKILLPRPPDNFLLEKNNALQRELAETKNLLQNVRQENLFQIETIKNLRGQLDKKITQAENFAQFSGSLHLLTDENLTLSGTVKNLKDELCKRDKFIEELQGKIAELENSAGKKLFGFAQKRN